MRVEIKYRKSMKKISLILVLATSLLIFISPAHATPILYNPFPADGSYVGYVEKQPFYINITESNLNTNNATLYVISLDYYKEGGQWDSHKMNCTGSAPSWTCSFNKSLVIVGSETVELFYFEASDYSGNTNSSGNQTNPWRFTVDIKPPDITFENPKNETYVSGMENITLTVSDTASGVNKSSVMYSFDNSTWFSMTVNTHYTAKWSTTSLANNETTYVYARARDMVGNEAKKRINVTVDNELPSIFVIEPKVGKKVSGIIFLEINVRDIYSGINASYVKYAVDSIERNMDCSGTANNYTCDEYFDTRSVGDGTHTINFYVKDNADNLNSASVQVVVDNTVLSASITNPTNNAYVRGITPVNVTLTHPEKSEGIKVRINNIWYNMICTGANCSYSWNTVSLADGPQTVFVNATSNLTYLVYSSVSVTVDNTKPQLLIDSPAAGEVNGTVYPKVIVTDNYGVVDTKTIFNISTFSLSMACSRQEGGKKYTCGGNFNTKILIDGNYVLFFYTEDLAGNQNYTSVVLSVKNQITNITATTTTLLNVTTTTLGWSGIIAIGEAINKIFYGFTQLTPTNFLIIGILVVIIIWGVWQLKKIISRQDAWEQLKKKWSRRK